MIELQETQGGYVRVTWQGFTYELGPGMARQNAAKLIELGNLPGRGLLVKCKFPMLSKAGAEYRVDWTGTKMQALAFAASLNLCAGEADQQRARLQQQKEEREARERAERIARFDGSRV